jgi:hypothetical protein
MQIMRQILRHMSPEPPMPNQHPSAPETPEQTALRRRITKLERQVATALDYPAIRALATEIDRLNRLRLNLAPSA